MLSVIASSMSATATQTQRNNTSDSTDLDSPDTPVLHPSVAAREGLREDAVPVRSDQRNLRVTQSRPASIRRTSSVPAPNSQAQGGDTGAAQTTKRPDSRARAASFDVRSGVAGSVTADASKELKDKPTTELRAGLAQKPFSIHTDLLVSKCPYFAAIQKPEIVTTTNAQSVARLAGPFSFPHLDEFAFAIFVRWIYGAQLQGPNDFHSMNHYLCLYVLAQEFQIEELENTTMNLIRHYYHEEHMTAPAFRLDYIYGATKGPCFMREFLITTAAYRALSDQEERSAGLSGSVKRYLRQGGDAAADYAEALCKLYRNDMEDVRKGDDCSWHVHTTTPKCPPAKALEPWEKP